VGIAITGEATREVHGGVKRRMKVYKRQDVLLMVIMLAPDYQHHTAGHPPLILGDITTTVHEIPRCRSLISL
jgi:hypothetical protein